MCARNRRCYRAEPISLSSRYIYGAPAQRAGGVPPTATPWMLLEQAAACADAVEALDQNGNGRLQLERLLLRVREIRRA